MFKKRKLTKQTRQKAQVIKQIEHDLNLAQNEPSAPVPMDPHSGNANDAPDTDQPPSAHIIRPAPVSASKNTQNVTIITDFEPNICKEYQKSGYCGYGDTCKFLHIRDLHPSKVPSSKYPQPKTIIEPPPTICQLCKKPYHQPAKTNCGHIFCLDCFLAYTKTQTKCPTCKKETNRSVSMIKLTDPTNHDDSSSV